MSEFQALGLSLAVHDPLVVGGGWLYNLDAEVASYSHTISAWGGFDAASLGLAGQVIDLESWIERGLGRHVRVYDPDGEVWCGFVNQVDLTLGRLAYSVGPLVELANRASCVYNGIDTAYNPPTQLGRLVTATVNDTDSQARYGIWEKILSAGKATAAEAGYARDKHLAERKAPPRSQTVGQAGGARLELALLGYWRWLSAYTYAQTATSGTAAASALVQAVLAADPNAIFSTDYSRLDTNALAVRAYENDTQTAEAKVKETVALGDTSYNRWTFGIYENRRAVYAAAPTTLAYTQAMQSDDADVYTAAGEKVRPWRVRPARWILMNDFLVGKPLGTALASDLRCAFIEQVTYTAPYGVSWNGGRLGTLDQVLAQIRMRGMA